MTPEALCQEAARRRLRLRRDGDALVISPKDRLTPDFVDQLRQHKVELLAWLEARAAGLTPDCAPWLHVAKQVLAGEWDGADRTTFESLEIGLRSIQHPLCRRALDKLRAAAP